MRIRQFPSVFLWVLSVPLVAQPHDAVTAPVQIRRIDWILLNATVDLLIDRGSGRWASFIDPPLYTYDSAKQQITTSALLRQHSGISKRLLRESLQDAASVFCLQPHLQHALGELDPLADVPCSATFSEIVVDASGVGRAHDVGAFSIPPPK